MLEIDELDNGELIAEFVCEMDTGRKNPFDPPTQCALEILDEIVSRVIIKRAEGKNRLIPEEWK